MPLEQSGAALFAGSAAEFMRMAPASSLTAHLQREFNRRWGTASESEVRSWRNSLTALAHVVARSGVDASGVGVELKLPSTSKRVDASFVGRNKDGVPTVALIELKQWDSAGPSLNPDNVIVGAKEHLHPSQQASAYAAYLRDSHSAFTERSFALRACAYLHNMSRLSAASLRGLRYEGILRDAPLYTGDDDDALGGFLGDAVGGGDGMELLPELVHGRYSPSKALIAGIAAALRGSPVWELLDEQRLAFNIVRGLVERAGDGEGKSVVIVRGGPGTGKSVVAAHLVVTLAQSGNRSVVHATGSKAFTTNLRAISPKPTAATAFFKYFNSFNPHETAENAYDVIVCDEAHRLRETSNDRFTKTALKSELSQTEEIVRASRISVFFLDERQNVRPGETGTVEVIRAAADKFGAVVHELALTGQFRCNGSNAYIDWVDTLMSASPQPVGGWRESGEYRFDVYDEPSTMERDLLALTSGGATGRMVAGFCWPWSDPNSDGSLIADVAIGRWQRPWNEKSPEQQKGKRPAPRADKHPYYLWATEPQRIGEVGCIYSAQGFEFDYCAVILGNDLVWREGIGWVASRDASEDPSIKRRRLPPEELTRLLWHTYRVLLTRGMKGTLVLSTDYETTSHLRELLRRR